MDNEKLHSCNCGCEDEHTEGHDHGCGCEDDGCGCGCGEHETMIVDLEDENGNVVQCEVVDGFEYKENEYVLVQNPNDGSIYLFKIVGEGEDSELVIPDDAEFEEVSAYYENSMSDEE